MTTDSTVNTEQPTARLMLKAFTHFEKHLLKKLSGSGFDDITASHVSLIRHLNPEGMKARDLAADANISKQAVSKISNDLVSKGYLAIQPDTRDARSKIIAYTDKGNRLIDLCVEIVKAFESQYVELLGKEDYNRLRKSLIAITEEIHDH